MPLPSGRAHFPSVIQVLLCGLLGTAVVDLLCVARSYRLPYRKDQEAYTGRWKGQLLWHFGRDPNSSVIRRDSE